MGGAMGSVSWDSSRIECWNAKGAVSRSSHATSNELDGRERLSEQILVEHHVVCSANRKWEDIELLLRHGLQHCMRVNPEDYALMLSRNCLFSTQEDLQHILEISVESLSVPAVQAVSSSTLSAFSAGRPTALVVDLGASGTSVEAVIDGHTLRRTGIRSQVGGQFVDLLLLHLLQQEGYAVPQPWFCKTGATVRDSFRFLHVFDIVRDLKHSLSRVSGASDDYELPDGTVVPSSSTAFAELCEQAYFPSSRSPQASVLLQTYIDHSLSKAHYLSLANAASSSSSAGTAMDVNREQGSGQRKRSRSLLERPLEALRPEAESLSDLIYCSLARSDSDYRKDLAANMLVVGGCSLAEGLLPRLQSEISDIMPSHVKLRVCNQLATERQHAAWLGGSVLSICGSFHQLWVSRQEYEEQGASRLVQSRFLR
eukprot:scaffold1365_cov163-Ochromonas_danica.AAC.43